MPVVRLRVLDGSTIELRDGVPRTRGECPTVRPCPHIRCQYHLWLDAFEPHWHSPEDRPVRPTRLLPRWLESPLPPSCALDVADSVPRGEVLEYKRIGELMATRPRAVEGVVARIKRRLLKGVPR